MTLRLPGIPAPLMTPRVSDRCFTPLWLLEEIQGMLGGIEVDPCWDPECAYTPPVRFTFEDDGLAQDWTHEGRPARVFCNPPYSDPYEWCVRLRDHAGPWVALVKIDPTTRWWAALTHSADCLALVSERVRFTGPFALGNSARWGSVLVSRRARPPQSPRFQVWERPAGRSKP